ncbi:MAG: phosphatidylserine/phosphatidylglycerophosphate/cardiolipin synthase family protein [Bdellovibrionales bacterium]|nr:phosphatidylserine/phosphatidylglycerophosphate/cardiolipin synthase family protein [Bdellovibrionales bacterium]
MKKLIKISGVSVLGLIGVIYLATAGFLWWSETTLRVEPVNESIYSRSKDLHHIELIDDGLLSLKKRIELIDSAKNSIDLEFFIYEIDIAGQIITQKLIEAARRGVKVRLLVDFAAPVFVLKTAYAKQLKKNNIEVKYYNTTNNLRIVSVQHRSHRKLLIIDNTVAMTGGRNIGDDYFNLSSHYNFLDSDIVIRGPIVDSILKSFNLYWMSNYADHPDPKQGDVALLGEVFFTKTKASEEILDSIKNLPLSEGSTYKSGKCNDIEFITDFPGVSLNNRQVFKYLSLALNEAKSKIYGESPYFVLRPDGISLLKELSAKGIKQDYLTNSLYSTDAFYTVSALTNSLGSIRDTGVNLYAYSGDKPIDYLSSINGVSERWGTHSKRAVIDNQHFIIGTYNVDPRSANLNSEVLIICRNSPELATHMSSSIKTRISKAWPVVESGKSYFTNLIKSASIYQVIKFIVVLPVAELFKFLL